MTSPVTIAIDVREAAGSRAGKGRYVEGLLKGLASLPPANVRYLLYTKEPLPISLSLPSESEVVLLPRFKLPGLRPFWTAQDMKRRGADVFLSPTGFLPAILSQIPSAIVVHDLAVWRYPSHPWSVILQEKLLLPLALKRVKKVFVVSKFTRDDLSALFHISRHKMTLAPNGVDGRYRPYQPGSPEDQADLARIQKTYHLPRRYILCVGTLQPRKNVAMLIEAYHYLPDELKATTGLVIVGKKGWNFEEIFAAVRARGEEQRVQFLDFVPEDDLPILYRNATASAYVSHYEGFGLPALEALASAIPHVSSNVTALPEVVGDAALLVSPTDQVAMTDALVTVLTDETQRSRLKLSGPKQAAGYTWTAMAQTVRDTLVSLARK